MIQLGVVYHLQNRMDGAGLRIVGSVHQAADSRMDRRSRAHGARLNCSKEFTVAQSMITDVSAGFSQSFNFGVRGGIAVGEVAIPSPANYAAIAYNDRANRHFARFQSTLGAAQRFLHPQFV